MLTLLKSTYIFNLLTIIKTLHVGLHCVCVFVFVLSLHCKGRRGNGVPYRSLSPVFLWAHLSPCFLSSTSSPRQWQGSRWYKGNSSRLHITAHLTLCVPKLPCTLFVFCVMLVETLPKYHVQASNGLLVIMINVFHWISFYHALTTTNTTILNLNPTNFCHQEEKQLWTTILHFQKQAIALKSQAITLLDTSIPHNVLLVKP